ncbi:MAG: hypothetical protein RI958_171, partial [Actinomycetota bacterium]
PSLVALVLLVHRLRESEEGWRSWAGLVAASEAGHVDAADVRRVAASMEATDASLRGLLVEPLELLSAEPCLAPLITHLDGAAATVTGPDLVELVLRSDGGATAARVASTLTNASLARLMIALARVSDGDVVIDPAAGEGEMLVQCARRLSDRVTLKGQEIATVPWRIARSRLAIMGVDADLGDGPTNSMVDDRFIDLRANVVLLDPPFEMTAFGEMSSSSEQNDGPGAPPLDAWLRYGLRHLDRRGRLILLVPGRFLRPRVRQRRGFVEFTELVNRLLGNGQLEAVVVLPGRTRADLLDDQTLLVVRGEGSGLEHHLARRVSIRPTSSRGEVNLGHLAELIDHTGDRWMEHAQDRGMVTVTSISTVEMLLEDTSPTPVRSAPLRRDRAVQSPPPAEDDEAPLRREIRVLEERLDDIRRRARDLADTLHDELLQMHLDDPARYRRIEDQVDALLRRL